MSNNVEPVIIQVGEVIAAEGEVIRNEVYEKLRLVGLFNNGRNLFPLIELAILSLLLGGIVAYELCYYTRDKELRKGKIASALLISVLMVVLIIGLLPFFETVLVFYQTLSY